MSLAVKNPFIRNTLLHLDFIKLHFASRMAYRFDFIVSFFAFFSFQLITPIFATSIYMAGGQFPGWNIYEMILLIGTITLIKGVAFMLFYGIVWNTQDLVRNGTLEILLIRPVNTLWLLVMDSFDEEDIGQVFGGLVVVIFAILHLHIITGMIWFYILLLVLGLSVFFSLALIISASAIKFVDTGRFYEISSIIITFGNYPKTVYNQAFGIILSVVFPLFIASFYPASVLLGFDVKYIEWSMFASVVLLILSYWFWRTTLKNYSGAGG
jgi:ABC-2 type transport system permease protein